VGNIRVIDLRVSQYLELQIKSGEAAAAKQALQELCRLYRKSFRLHPSILSSVETAVVGALFTSADLKVKRWALNAIAQFGREQTCSEAIGHALKKYGDDPEIAAAAVAALFHVSKSAQKQLERSNIIDKDIVVLAALQQVPASKLDMSSTRVNIEKSEPEILKLGLVVVGMNKAPAHLFDPRHDNAAIVKALGGHHDQIVSQYSVWAITENPSLSLSDLGIDLKNVDRQPANVRSWAYQLVAMDKNAAAHVELIRQGAEDQDVEARRGVTLGLRETYFEGLDEFVTDWLFSEHDDEVRSSLVDHIVKQAPKSPNYEETAIALYSKEADGSKARQRMEAAAAGGPLYTKLRRISVAQDRDLFAAAMREEGTTIVTNNTFHIGSIAGNAAFNGDAINTGSMPINQTANIVNQLVEALEKAASIVDKSDISADLKAEVAKAVAAAKSKPDKSLLKSAFEWLGKAQTAIVKTAQGAKAAQDLAEIGTSVGGLLSAF
jgi:hypothetical protein